MTVYLSGRDCKVQRLPEDGAGQRGGGEVHLHQIITSTNLPPPPDHQPNKSQPPPNHHLYQITTSTRSPAQQITTSTKSPPPPDHQPTSSTLRLPDCRWTQHFPTLRLLLPPQLPGLVAGLAACPTWTGLAWCTTLSTAWCTTGPPLMPARPMDIEGTVE